MKKGLDLELDLTRRLTGSVIQATGTVEFEDGLWIGNYLKAKNGLLRVCSVPGV